MGVERITVAELLVGAGQIARDCMRRGHSLSQHLDYEEGRGMAQWMHALYTDQRQLYDQLQRVSAGTAPASREYVAGYNAAARALGLPPHAQPPGGRGVPLDALATEPTPPRSSARARACRV